MDIVRLAEEAAREALKGQVGHDFSHVDRVRHWALQIASAEGYPDLEMVEVTALLHDIGRGLRGSGQPEGTQAEMASPRTNHGELGAQMAGDLLRRWDACDPEVVIEVTQAIRLHSVMEESDSLLAAILRDADMLDSLGAAGLMRAFTSKAGVPEYDPEDVRGKTWGLGRHEWDARFDAGQGVGRFISDQVNFQIHFHENLNTASARRIADPLVEYMRGFLLQLESEVSHANPYCDSARRQQ